MAEPKDKSLESWIWDAACSIRGAKDAPKYKDYILPLIFTKRLCDVFDDELDRIAKEVGSRKKAFALVKADPKLVRFYLPLVPDDPEQPVWSIIRKLSDQIGEGVTTHMRAIAKSNPLLQGIIDRIDFNATTHGQRDIDDDRLSNLIEAISTKRLGLDDVEADIIGKSYEYLIRKFAEGGGQSAGEFYTPPEVGEIMARVLQPEPGMEIYDPTCGSGGLLIKCELEMERRADIPVRRSEKNAGKKTRAPLKLYGQEYIAVTFKNPKFRDRGGRQRCRRTRSLSSRLSGQILCRMGLGPTPARQPERQRPRRSGNAGTNKEKIVLQWFVVRDLFALSSDYQAREKETQLFFAEVQNKLLFAVAGTTAAEISYGVTWNTVRRNIFNWKLTESGFSNPLHGGKGGQECSPSIGNSFLNPHEEIDKTTHHLPHWQQGETWIFVTWRLGDSLPKSKLAQWKEEREIWLKHHPEPWDEKTEADYHERFSRQIDDWLDQGSGACVLKDPANAKIVADALRHFDGKRYEIASFVVMPNHVHALFRPLGKYALPGILKSWKGFTAREINQRLGKSGALWQNEYWDRLIRNERHFFKVAEYIRKNPAKAKLREGQYSLWEKESGLYSPKSAGL